MVSFNNIIGHKDIVKHLQNAIKTEKISHSYIFTRRPGSGKKLIATTYAMTLQCEAGGTEPCQKCDSCKKALGKNHPDIIMVNHEKSGTISIDEIREQVIHDVAVKPYCSPHKIYIIPEAEMMTLGVVSMLSIFDSSLDSTRLRFGKVNMCVPSFTSSSACSSR